MKRLLLVLILSTFAFGLGAAPKSSMIDQTIKSVVRVETTNGVGEPQQCTGFRVDGVVLTARHCLHPNQIVTVDGKLSKMLKMDQSLAMLQAPPSKALQLVLRSKALPIGEQVFVLGFGQGWMQVFGRGVAIDGGGDIGLDGPLLPGMSGGPVVDVEGKVVGLSQSTNAVMSVACGQDALKAFLTGSGPSHPQ